MKSIQPLLTGIILFPMILMSCNTNTGKKIEQSYVDSLESRLNALTAEKSQNEANKMMVADFYQQLFGDKNVESIDKYIGDVYIQHNPMLPDGKEVLKNAVREWFKGAPKEKVDIHHLGADGDFVYIHTKANFGGKTQSVIDIFRIENGKIIEHWDVIQEVPEKSANPHPMF